MRCGSIQVSYRRCPPYSVELTVLSFVVVDPWSPIVSEKNVRAEAAWEASLRALSKLETVCVVRIALEQISRRYGATSDLVFDGNPGGIIIDGRSPQPASIEQATLAARGSELLMPAVRMNWEPVFDSLDEEGLYAVLNRSINRLNVAFGEPFATISRRLAPPFGRRPLD